MSDRTEAAAIVGTALSRCLLGEHPEASRLTTLPERQALARKEAGLPATGPIGRPPRWATPFEKRLAAQEHKAYRTAMRRTQRRQVVAREQRKSATAPARRQGLSVRLVGVYRVYGREYPSPMPSDKGGAQDYRFLTGAKLTSTLKTWEAGDEQKAGEYLLRAFERDYLGKTGKREG